MTRMLAIAFSALLALAAPAFALSVDQVIDLKKAGVSEKTIRAMVRAELDVRAMGGVGRYVVKQKGGDEVIVYQASSPKGVVDYQWDSAGYAPMGMDRVIATLGAEDTRPRQKAKSAAKAAKPAKPAKPAQAAKGYTLHIASFRKRNTAEKQVAALTGKGVKARVDAVDLADKGRWYRVVAGEFQQKDQAQKQGSRLKGAGSIESFRVIPR